MVETAALLAAYDAHMRMPAGAVPSGITHEHDGPVVRIVGGHMGRVRAPRDVGVTGAALPVDTADIATAPVPGRMPAALPEAPSRNRRESIPSHAGRAPERDPHKTLVLIAGSRTMLETLAAR
ncbi:hypothetical protein [Actinoplanes flavus]|uniref:hypothetical protein n=1 Tax=Actinoplanes flavus TaxID=2820290 RepID=UPI001EE6007F|nr:hypothetical protein [Actinoplanes flavus]